MFRERLIGSRSESREKAMLKNVVFSGSLKFLSILFGLVLVPLTVGLINPENYGIWLTLSSILTWFNFLDIGITNGLRNKITEGIALERTEDVRRYISTSYVLVIVILILIMPGLFIINELLDWEKILNIRSQRTSEVVLINRVLLIYFAFNFISKVLNIILISVHRLGISSLIDTIGQAVTLVAILLLSFSKKGNLYNVVLLFCFVPIINSLVFHYFIFVSILKSYKPSLSFIDFSKARDLLNTGLKFFVIQVAGIIQYQTSLFIIAKEYTMSDVTSYNILFKYFGFLSMVFSLLLSPLWSGIADAAANGDYAWIKRIKRIFLLAAICFVIFGLVMLAFCEPVISFWIGDWFNVPWKLCFWILIYVYSTIFSSVFVNILNGLGEINLQFYICLLSPVIFFISNYFLGNYFGLGLVSVVIAAIVSNFNGLIIAPIQLWSIQKKWVQYGK